MFKSHDAMCQPLIFVVKKLGKPYLIDTLSTKQSEEEDNICIIVVMMFVFRDKYWNCKNIYCESFFCCFTSVASPRKVL
jgi:hypothetical protein